MGIILLLRTNLKNWTLDKDLQNLVERILIFDNYIANSYIK